MKDYEVMDAAVEAATTQAHADNDGNNVWPYDKGHHETPCTLCDALDAFVALDSPEWAAKTDHLGRTAASCLAKALDEQKRAASDPRASKRDARAQAEVLVLPVAQLATAYRRTRSSVG